MNRKELIRTIYLYLFSLVGLVLITIGLVRLVDLGLKAYIFTKADRVDTYPRFPVPIKEDPREVVLTEEEQEKLEQKRIAAEEKNKESRRQRDASNSIALIIVGTPLFLYHWRTIQKDKRSN